MGILKQSLVKNRPQPALTVNLYV